MQPTRENTANFLLRNLTDNDFELLRGQLSFVDLPVRQLLEARDKPIEQVYFFESGIGSTVIGGGANHPIEVGMLGREGMSGLPVIHETDRSLYDTFMQSTGWGWRVPADVLVEAQRSSLSLRKVLLRYAHSILTQMASTALANGRYKVEERTARWLLMAHDRTDGDTIILTHEFLSVMLGTRRAGVTVAIGLLESRGIVRGHRGSIEILNREALEKCANGCYGDAEKEYTRLFRQLPGIEKAIYEH